MHRWMLLLSSAFSFPFFSFSSFSLNRQIERRRGGIPSNLFLWNAFSPITRLRKYRLDTVVPLIEQRKFLPFFFFFFCLIWGIFRLVEESRYFFLFVCLLVFFFGDCSRRKVWGCWYFWIMDYLVILEKFKRKLLSFFFSFWSNYY